MKISSIDLPKSAFLSIQKDLSYMIDKFLKNKRLKKLLYYNTPDALSKPDLDDDQTFGLLNNNIRIVPKIQIDGAVLNYIIISFDNFITNAENPEFRDNIISFDIMCHFDQWNLGDFKLRPYMIAAEIDSMINQKHLSGIGKLDFLGCSQLIINDEFAGVSLMYQAIHGDDDKRHMPNPKENKEFEEEFNKLWNN